MPLDLDEYSVTNFRNMDDLSSRRRAGVSNSATRPANIFPIHWEKVRLNNFTLINNTETSQTSDEILKIMFNVPSLSTKTRSLSITVGIRCAIVQTVQFLNSVRMIFCMRLSVAVSTDAVASSSTSILACLSKARPRETSCRCPTLQLSPLSKTAHCTSKRKKKIYQPYATSRGFCLCFIYAFFLFFF